MAKKQTKKKVNFIIYSCLTVAVVLFSIFSSLSENGYLSFDFPRWSDFGTALGMQDQVNKSPLSIHYIDVGNADCILVKSPQGNVLFDAGETDDEGTILQYLRKQKIKKIDYVIATHPHADHIGSMPKVLKSFEIGEFIMPEMPEEIMPTTQVYKDLLSTITNEKIKMNYAKPGRVINLGDLSLKLLTPLDKYEDINDMSIVTKLTYKEFTALFMGDAGTQVEKDIMNKYPESELNAQVLKVGHHGSAYSSLKEFIKAVGAKYYYIPCGLNNKYKHPSPETLSTLKEIKGEVFRADYNGTIIVLSDGNETRVVSENK